MKNEPGAWEHSDKATTPELSVAVGSSQVTTVPGDPKLVSSVIPARQSMTGRVWSTVDKITFKFTGLMVHSEMEYSARNLIRCKDVFHILKLGDPAPLNEALSKKVSIICTF